MIGTSVHRPAVPAVDDTAARPAMPVALRTPAIVLGVVAAVVVAALAVVVAGRSSANSVDRWVEQVIAAHRGLRGMLPQLAVVAGEPATVIVCVAVLAAWCLYRRRPTLAAVAVLGPGLTGLAETVLKPLIGRTISSGTEVAIAFPSGHTAGATALGLVLAIAVAVTIASTLLVDRVRAALAARSDRDVKKNYTVDQGIIDQPDSALRSS